jgi:hypothetical protein
MHFKLNDDHDSDVKEYIFSIRMNLDKKNKSLLSINYVFHNFTNEMNFFIRIFANFKVLY